MFSVVIMICFKNCDTEDLLHYGDPNYRFVSVQTNAGKHGITHYGSMGSDDYSKWASGKTGTVFIYSTAREGRGWRVSIGNIVSIVDYGSTPGYLPANFRLR